MFIWSDLSLPGAPPFGKSIPLKKETTTKDGVTTTVNVLDYYAIVTIVADLAELRRWYTHNGGQDRIFKLLSIEDETEMKIDDAKLGSSVDGGRRAIEERVIARVNKVLKPAGKGFVFPLTSHIEDFEYVHEFVCVWTICVGAPPLRAFTPKTTPEDRVEMFFNRPGVPERMQRLSTLFGEEFLEVVKPVVLVDRRKKCRNWLRTTGEGEIVAEQQAKGAAEEN
ncbi:hypothetical protein CALVIDRAFT_595709 [Calocera viscosa TUFC12733]|uniref:Uncharacterized protein n=1 Tax=Calocera viscosa (strain TUFC12733) TaxID=1330018 RepID=A0A167QAJ1_CALVF|nr:hypothetical protein CALVIDRAFT_595709 [Calocera viscosa TUFC12733]